MPSHTTKAQQYFNEGNFSKATKFFRKALKQDPLNPTLHFNLATSLLRSQNAQAAAHSFQTAIKLKPDLVDAHNNLAVTYITLQQDKNALRTIKQALKIHPQEFSLHLTLGKIFLTQKKFSKALKPLAQAVSLNPTSTQALNDHGIAQFRTNQIPQATTSFNQALKLNPHFDLAYKNLGIVYNHLGDYTQAITYLTTALNYNAKDLDTYIELGKAHLNTNQYQQAIHFLSQAVSQAPDNSDVWYYLGRAHLEAENYLSSHRALHQSTLLDPDSSPALPHLYFLYRQTSKWSKSSPLHKPLSKRITTDLKTKKRPTESPQQHNYRSQNHSQNLLLAKAWSRYYQNLKTPTQFNFRPHSPPPTLNIGYLSADFQDHATSHLLCQLFPLHNRPQFKIHAYSYGPNSHDLYRHHIKSTCDVFRDVQDFPLAKTAETINQDKIDILIDLKGLTGNTRYHVLAHHPAPIQITWLGYPGTTGADFIDYAIVDPTVVPPNHQKFYTEKLIHLPHSYQINDNHQAISSKLSSKHLPPISKKSIVFGAFHQPYKIQPKMFSHWLKLLKNVPNSILWLLDHNKLSTHYLKQVAQQHHISPNRLAFSPNLDKPDHLARLKHATLCLDTYITNGHTTTSDCLWAGVPVVTLQGNHFASRVSSSLLKSLGLSELITHTTDDYFNLALHLATNPQKLQNLKSKIAKHTSSLPLFNSSRFTRNLETAYLTAWNRYLQGKPPRAFRVVDPQPLIS